MIKYIIHTENKNLKLLTVLLNKMYSDKGFTIAKVIGYWKGKKENSLKIEIILDDSEYITSIQEHSAIVNLCNAIKKLNNQEAVLLTIEPIKAEII